MWTYVVVAVVTAVIVSVAWILLFRKISNDDFKEIEEDFRRDLKDEKERREREVDWERNYREEQEKEWSEGRKENILESMEALFTMFFSVTKMQVFPQCRHSLRLLEIQFILQVA